MFSSLRQRSAPSLARRFIAAREGIIAVEFALIAPLMIATYFAVTELSDAYTAKSKVTVVASTAADLAAQETAICDAEMNDVFAALSAIMFPYPVNDMKIKITSLVDTGNGTVKVAWSDVLNDTPRAVNSIVSIPDGLVTSGSGSSVILAEVTYHYSSPAGYMIYGSIPLSDKFYLHPRRSLKVARSANGC